MKTVTLYTDGACSGNPGPGGWGCVIISGEGDSKKEKIYSGGEKCTTNNRMELTAAVTALNAIAAETADTAPARIVSVYTDSQYVKNGITSWINNWKRNGWRTASKEPVKNKDLWIALDEVVQKLSVRWVWVKGHAGIQYNELVDKLTQEEIAKIR